ncbi:hypothetical protein OG21DRAFT_1400157, partial [Imleria badia]
HHTCPHFSIHAQCKTLCHLHNVRPAIALVCSLLHASNVYLEIIHCVNQCIQGVLNHNGQEWHLQTQCPACF